MLKKNELISIAMTSYNGEKYIAEQLDSILTQTYDNFELIICDDCSKDSTVKIIKDYCGKDSRIKLYVNEKNLGFKKNFEKAISLCKGEYIALSDQDDIWLPEHLEKLYKMIGNYTIACDNALIIDETGKETGQILNKLDAYEYDPPGNNKMYSVLCTRSVFPGSSMLIDGNYAKKMLPIPDYVEYHDAWLSCCACCINGLTYDFGISRKYRLHGKNVSLETHKKISLGKNIKQKLKTFRQPYFNSRYLYCEELEKRFISDMPEDKKKIFLEIKDYLHNRNKHIKIFSNILFLCRYYKYLYYRNNYKEIIPRIAYIFLK